MNLDILDPIVSYSFPVEPLSHMSLSPRNTRIQGIPTFTTPAYDPPEKLLQLSCGAPSSVLAPSSDALCS